jgi:DNA-binding LacI/PurR family transcriptional regulator
MSKVFAKNGYMIELREGKKAGDTYDVKINGFKADLKSVSSHNNIIRHAKKAINKQGAQMVFFEINEMDDRKRQALANLKRKGIKVLYYEKSKNKVQAI